MGGQILGDRYEVERQLGKKSGRWTLQARDLKTQETVILKLLFLDEELQVTDLRLFTREIEALQLLQHPATPRYRSYFEINLPRDGKALALVQSYIEGVSLAACLRAKHRFSEAEVKAIAQQVLQILVDLHSQSPPIIHRDIRPENILLKPGLPVASAEVALVDFGSVKALTTDTTALTLVGTSGYMPPEQTSGRVLAVSDLYSLGATLAECVTATPPAQMRRGMRIDFQSRAELTPAFADWLKQLLAPGLEHRWRSADKALAALDAL